MGGQEGQHLFSVSSDLWLEIPPQQLTLPKVVFGGDTMPSVLTIERTVAITIDKVSLVWLPEDSPDIEGCRAFAYVSYPAIGRERRSEWFASVGTWGMPSDIPKDARKEIEQEQLADLKQHLSVFGIDVSGFDDIPVEGRDYS